MNRLLGSSGVAAAVLASPAARAASIDDCGNIHVEASAQCEVVPPGVECEGYCEPLSFTAACEASCEGECNANFEVDCAATCEGDCTGDCEADPGSFDCRGSCEIDCEGSCAGSCEASGNMAQCQASCEATCTGECDASCEGTPPEVDCDVECQASCEGSCSAQANLDCQIDCQGGCTADLEGGCEIDCDGEEGALFCDGQYVDHGNNLEDCIAALDAYLDVEVEGYANASCEGNTCTAEAGCSAKCSAAPRGRIDAFGLLLAGAVALTLARPRRRGVTPDLATSGNCR